MKRSLISLLGVLCVLALVVPAPAAVIVDGNVDGNDSYAAFLDDAIGEADFESDSWDIQRVSSDMDELWVYFGLTSVGDFDSDGSDTSFEGETIFFGLLGANSTTTYQFELGVVDGTVDLELDGVELVEGVDYIAAHDAQLEFALALTLVPALTDSFAFLAQLDDTGQSPDDQLSGQLIGVPEPTTFVVLALGAVAVVWRKR